MPNFKFVISDGNKSYQVEKDQKDCPVMGKIIGETISGEFLGLEGYELAITGGSDKDGFPMRSDVDGTSRKRIIVTDGIGFHAYADGMRKRKMVRGNAIAIDIIQINCKVSKKGAKPIEEVLGKKEEAPAEGEAPKEEKKAEKKEEKKEKAEAKPEASDLPKEEKKAEAPAATPA